MKFLGFSGSHLIKFKKTPVKYGGVINYEQTLTQLLSLYFAFENYN